MISTVADDVTEPDGGLDKGLKAFGLPLRDVAVLALAGLSLLVFYPWLTVPFGTPRLALGILGAAPGLVATARLALLRDRSAQLASGFAAVALVAAALSDSFYNSLIGRGAGTGNSLAVILVGVGWWGLGRSLSGEARQSLVSVMLAGLAVGAVVGWGQAVADLSGAIPMQDAARAAGLADNSVFFGGLMAGAVGLSAAQLTNWRRPASLALLGLFAGAINLSGSRVAVIGGLVAFVVAVSGTSRRTVMAAVGAVVAGVSASLLLLALVPSRVGSVDRIETDVVGSGGRLYAWEAAGGAFVERPLLGWGPGQFQAATSSRLGVDYARAEGSVLFADAHNLLIDMAVVTGTIGAALAVAWVVVAARRSTRPFIALVAGTGVTWLLQPMSIITMPTVALAFGAAHRERTRDQQRGRRSVLIAGSALTVIAAIAATSLVVSDAYLYKGVQEWDFKAHEQASQWRPRSAFLVGLHAVTLARLGAVTGNPGAQAEAIRLATRATELDPQDPSWWAVRGQLELGFGDPAVAEQAFRESLGAYSFFEPALEGLRGVGERLKNESLVDEANATLCDMGSPACDDGR